MDSDNRVLRLGLPSGSLQEPTFALFAKAGLDPETAPATWDEMQSMAEQCQDPANGVVGFEYYTQPTGEGITWQFQVWLWAAGGQFLNEDNTAAAFNTRASG